MCGLAGVLARPGEEVPESTLDALSRALAHRQPRYRAIAERWGVTVSAEDIARVRTAADVDDLIAGALEAG